MRVVIDTQICVRGLFRPSYLAGRILDAFRARRFTLITSEPLLAELADVMGRPKVRNKYGLTSRAVSDLLALLRERAELVEIAGTLHLCRDPKDDKFLETAITGKAELLVSEDKDLLVVKVPGLRILTAVEFLVELDPPS